jgi:flagellar hook protein FlgE
MFTSFSTALSALDATSTAIDVIGNNLANMDTPGFKTSEICFEDLVTESLGAGLGTTQVGFGTGTPITVREFSQGAIQSTSGVLDAAVQGEGFFIVDDSSGNQYYTRAGNFETDKTGNLLTDTGFTVQGWTAINPVTGQVDTNGPIGNIVVPVGTLKAPTPTSSLTVDLNLNSAATADATSDFSVPMTIQDSLGTSHVLTLSFEKTGANTWNYSVSIPGADLADPTASTIIPATPMTFDANGNLTPPDGPPITFTLPDLADGAASGQTISWNPYNSDGSGRITQFGQPSASSASSQNGTAAAELVNVGLANGGLIVAQYSDGTQATVGQVALASIRNPNTLVATGGNDFQLSELTATPAIGTPGTGGRGTIQGGSVEASTVDIATEFTNLIVYQRAYEANGKVVTTADQMSQDTINLITA